MCVQGLSPEHRTPFGNIGNTGSIAGSTVGNPKGAPSDPERTLPRPMDVPAERTWLALRVRGDRWCRRRNTLQGNILRGNIGNIGNSHLRPGRPSGGIDAHCESGPGARGGASVAFGGASTAPHHPGTANDRARPGSANQARRRDREGWAGGGIDARRGSGPGAHVASRDAFDGASTAPQVPPTVQR